MLITNCIRSTQHRLRCRRQKPKNNLNNLLIKYLRVAQIFGTIPLRLNRDVDKVEFDWWYYKTLYTLLLIVLFVIYTLFQFIWAINSSNNFFACIAFAWNLRTTLGLIACLYTAYKWPTFITRWQTFETSLTDIIPDGNKHYNPKRTIYSLTIIFIVAGLLEQGIFLALITQQTIQTNQITTHDNIIQFFRLMFPEIHSNMEVPILASVILFFLNAISTFQWQFINVFIIVIVITFALRFRQFNIYVKKLNQQIKKKYILKPEFANVFEETRKMYALLVEGCNLLNWILQEMIFVAILGGFHFLTVFIFQGKGALDGYGSSMNSIFYGYNGVFVTGHFAALILYISWINEESLKVLQFIFDLPTSYYNEEVEYFIECAESQVVAIKFVGMFAIHRNIILTTANIILVVQLILIEFDKSILRNIGTHSMILLDKTTV